MGFVVATSKEGVNVLGTAGTVLNNLSYHSDYNTLKYYASGTTDLVINYANYYQIAGTFIGVPYYTHIVHGTVNHNLGYIPFFTSFMRSASGTAGTLWNMCPQLIGDAFGFARVESYGDTANLYFQLHIQNDLNSGFATQTFLYKIFRNNTGL